MKQIKNMLARSLFPITLRCGFDDRVVGWTYTVLTHTCTYSIRLNTAAQVQRYIHLIKQSTVLTNKSM